MPFSFSNSLGFPLGISFYTFQQISFLFYIHKNPEVKVSPTSYTLFVLFFPQLIAGPIVKYEDIVNQFSSISIIPNNIKRALCVFSMGLAKKVLIADTISKYVDNAHIDIAQISFLDSWIASTAFSFQIYFDFSGYGDMAIGLCWILNIKIIENFNNPYLSRNLTSFWNNWHISLTQWFKEYFFYPISLKLLRKNQSRATKHLPLLLTMTIIGIWHGNGVNFILFGFIHGVALIFLNYFNKFTVKSSIIPTLLTFLFVNCMWVFFRSRNLQDSFYLLSKMFNFKNFNLDSTLLDIKLAIALLFSFLLIIIGIDSYTFKYNKQNYKPKLIEFYSMAIVLGVSITVLLLTNSREFIYYKF